MAFLCRDIFTRDDHSGLWTSFDYGTVIVDGILFEL